MLMLNSVSTTGSDEMESEANCICSGTPDARYAYHRRT